MPRIVRLGLRRTTRETLSVSAGGSIARRLRRSHSLYRLRRVQAFEHASEELGFVVDVSVVEKSSVILWPKPSLDSMKPLVYGVLAGGDAGQL